MWVKVKVLKSGAVFVAVMFWGTVFVEMMFFGGVETVAMMSATSSVGF